MSVETVSSQAAPVRGRTRPSRARHGRATPYLFLLPFGLFFLLFFIVPIFYTLYESLYTQQRSGLGLIAPTISFTGLTNYFQVFHDHAFYDACLRILLYGAIQVPVMLVLALILALLMDTSTIWFRNFFRTAFFLPYAVPSVIAAILWGFLFVPGISPIVNGFQALGWKSFNPLGPSSILWSIANIATWEWTGYNMIIIFAALQAIPHDLYEAARMDGASGLGIAWRIKIPLVAPALVMTCIFSIIGTLQLFNEPQVLSSISTNISSSYTPNIYIYNVAFRNGNFYYASAMAVVLALVTFVFSFGFMRFTQRYSGV
jgi:multiple sugar transport system permease protein